MHTALAGVVASSLMIASAAGPQRAPPSVDDRAQVQYRLGWDLLRSEDFGGAAAAFQTAVDLDPKFALAFYGLGKAQMGLRRFVDASTAFAVCRDLYAARAGEKFSSQIDANRYREDRMMELRELQLQYSKGPQNFQTQNTLRQIENAMRLTQEATDRGRNVGVDASVPAFVSVALGSAYFRSNRIADAEREYKAAIDADGRAGEAHNNLAVVYMLTERLDAAAKELELAEKSGFRVNPELKRDVAERRKR